MDIPNILNSKSIKGFVKSSLLLIGLFAVLYCGVAALLFSSYKNIESNKNIEKSKNIDKIKNIENINDGNNELVENKEVSKENINKKRNVIGKDIDDKVLVLSYFLLFLPIIIFITVFLRFSYLVKSYNKKLFGSSCDEGVFFKLINIEAENLEKKKLETKNLEDQNLEKDRNRKQEFDLTIEACQILIKTFKSDSDKEEKALQELKDMLERFIKMNL